MTESDSTDEQLNAPDGPGDDGWLMLNPEREAVEGALFLEEMLQRVVESSYHWKWAAVALYNLTYAACILALRGTWPVLLINKEQMKKALENQRSSEADAAVWVGNTASLDSLYRRVQDPSMMSQWGFSKPLPENDAQNAAIQWLVRKRNEFTHFRAMLFAHDIQVFPENFLAVLEITKFLVNDSGNICGFDDDFCSPLKEALLRIELHVTRLHVSLATERSP